MDKDRRLVYICGALITVALAVMCHVVTAEEAQSNWHWTWSCVSGKCVRSDAPQTGTDGVPLQTCRLTCGSYGALWPRPTDGVVLGSRLQPIHPSRVTFQTAADDAVREYLEVATHIFLGNLATECGPNCSVVPNTDVTVRIDVLSAKLALDWSTDESYSLTVQSSETQVLANVQAPTVFGARHALETLSQLVTGSSGQLLLVSSARISDRPVFSHRGLLLDSARNFLPLSDIKRTLDGMAASKMNVLHWHATDTHSFPLELPSVPQMTRYGAYSAQQVYSPNDVSELLEYAKYRGVRVILEIDSPSHAGNGWQWAEQEGLGRLAVCVNQQPWRKYCIQPPCGQLNPANSNMYSVLRQIYRDVAEQFPAGESLHMGGDEVFIGCWNSTPEVVEWMQTRGLGRSNADFLQVWAEFHRTALAIWDEVTGRSNSSVIIWSSHLTDPAVIGDFIDKSRYVIETWVEASSSLPQRLLSLGYKIIFATKDTWYLDHGFWGSTTYHTWKHAYDNRIPRQDGVFGGEAAMWGELVDAQALDDRLWPRAAAVAERLWADPTTDSADAAPRLYSQRQRLVTRGIRAAAVTPGWCMQNEGAC